MATTWEAEKDQHMSWMGWLEKYFSSGFIVMVEPGTLPIIEVVVCRECRCLVKDMDATDHRSWHDELEEKACGTS